MQDIQEPEMTHMYGAHHPFVVQWNTITIRANAILGLLVIIFKKKINLNIFLIFKYFFIEY